MEFGRLGQGPVPVHLAHPLGDWPGLIRGILEPCHGGDFLHVARKENLIGGLKIFEAENAFMHLHAVGAHVRHMAGAGDAGKEGAIGNGCINNSVFDHEHI